MRGRMSGAIAASATFKQTKKDNQHVRDSIQKMKESLATDAKDSATRKSKLPNDWRNRILK